MGPDPRRLAPCPAVTMGDSVNRHRRAARLAFGMMAVTLAATGPVAAQTPAGPAPAPLPATAPAPALPPPGQKLSLPEAIALGLRQNPTIRSGVSSQSAAQYRVPQAQSGYYPRLDLFGDFGRSRLPSTSTGEDITSDALDTSLRARQLVWDFGKTSALVDEARAGVRSAEADLERLRELVVLNVRQSYFQLLAARRLVGVAEAAVQRAELNLQSARGFFEVGIRAKSDVARAEVDVANARVDLIRARNAVRFAEANLANALGLSATTPIDIEDILTYEPVVLDQGLLLRDALSNRPELAQARARLDAARAQLAGARAGWGPDLNIVGSVGTTTDPVREGLTVNETFDDDRSNVLPALERGDIQCDMRTVGEHQGRPRMPETQGTIIGTIDISLGGDGVVADGSIQTAADLKGKVFAVEPNVPARLLAQLALKEHGLTFDDLEIRAADRAGGELQDKLVRCGLEVGPLDEPQRRRLRRPWLGELEGPHHRLPDPAAGRATAFERKVSLRPTPRQARRSAAEIMLRCGSEGRQAARHRRPSATA